MTASDFSLFCATNDEAEALRHMLDADPDRDLVTLCREAGVSNSASSFRVLLEYGAPLTPRSLLNAARKNRLDVLEVALKRSKLWCPQLPSLAAIAGNTRFLMRAFKAGCPVWKTAQDGTPDACGTMMLGPPGRMPRDLRKHRRGSHRETSGGPLQWPWTEHRPSVEVKDWSLVVSPNLVRSGPVLLLAAKKGAPLTPYMEYMLDNVRRRALALAGCFHRAACLSKGHGPAARKWDSMGGVPVEIVQIIATIARISIIAGDYIE